MQDYTFFLFINAFRYHSSIAQILVEILDTSALQNGDQPCHGTQVEIPAIPPHLYKVLSVSFQSSHT